jgi:SepF-like predicted cell division protein (DUF552 family)
MKRILEKILKPSTGARAPTHVSREPKFVELDWRSGARESAHFLRVLQLNDFTDVEGVLDHLRDRNNVLILKVKPSLVAEKMELKRALKRIQRTTSAIGGDIAGIKEDIIVITPPSVRIARAGVEAIATESVNAAPVVAQEPNPFE